MENSTLGGQGGGQRGLFSISNSLKKIFPSKWSKNHFQTQASQIHTQVTKLCQSYNCMCCGQNFACSGRYCACCSKICYQRRQKFACLKVKIHFLQKVLKKWSSFRKKIKKNFHKGGSGPYMEFSIIFYLNPSLI